ncbi:restriction endonuclease subunit S [Paraclostridium bifermentans]|uniref:restriction endonuclease subunit S n=1 Tax=Paraclostridium bifermentans TaxID=1490 RepID=UPI0022E5225A|nr:restriction endonuclease subunit S [Paraclostridium bifermentans]
MKSNYKRIGDYIREVKIRNKDLSITDLRGINIDKYFMTSVANTIGTDMSKYKVVKKGQFACNRMHVGRDKRLPVALLLGDDSIIVSPAYTVFEVIDESLLNPEYLMMWFSRKEFDRESWFYTDSDVRGGLSLDDFFDIKVPILPIGKQREMVKEYNTILNRIKLNESIIEKLEIIVQSLYYNVFKHNEELELVELAEYVETNPKISIKKGSVTKYVEMSQLRTNNMLINDYAKRPFTGGSKFENMDTLLARITPCLENGKTAFVNILDNNEIGAGSTEFIVMRAKETISPYWVYCLARDNDFREYAISSMIGSSGRQRVDESYLKRYKLKKINTNSMNSFHNKSSKLFNFIKIKSIENKKLYSMKYILLLKMSTMGE